MGTMNIREAAAELEAALDRYIETAAGMDVDPTAIAWALGDRWGALRFYPAMRASQLRGSEEYRRRREAELKLAKAEARRVKA